MLWVHAKQYLKHVGKHVPCFMLVFVGLVNCLWAGELRHGFTSHAQVRWTNVYPRSCVLVEYVAIWCTNTLVSPTFMAASHSPFDAFIFYLCNMLWDDVQSRCVGAANMSPASYLWLGYYVAYFSYMFCFCTFIYYCTGIDRHGSEPAL